MNRRNVNYLRPLSAGMCIVLMTIGLGIHNIRAEDPQVSPSIPPTKQGQEQLTPELERIVHELQATYQKIQTYRADFSQNTASKILPNTRESSGYIMFKKPGRMRWIYQKPRPQEVILQPDRIYIYLPKENQVMTKSVGDYLSGITPTKMSPAPTGVIGAGLVFVRRVGHQVVRANLSSALAAAY